MFVGTSLTAGPAVPGLEREHATVVKTGAPRRAEEDDSRDERLRILLMGCGCTTDVFVGTTVTAGRAVFELEAAVLPTAAFPSGVTGGIPFAVVLAASSRRSGALMFLHRRPPRSC